MCKIKKTTASSNCRSSQIISEFDDVVSVDLHYIKPGLFYLHIIGEFTKYSQATTIKHKNESTKAFLTLWIGIFRAPCKLFSDNGSEFIGEDFVKLCETFNIKATTAASYSPWSNGTCECRNQFTNNMLQKVYDDAKCNYITALAWAINAKN